jgi:hypothetical protein
MKIYTVAFNDGGWYSGSRPEYQVVAESKESAIDDIWASEFKIDGYIIEVYDEKTYQRDINLKTLGV